MKTIAQNSATHGDPVSAMPTAALNQRIPNALEALAKRRLSLHEAISSLETRLELVLEADEAKPPLGDNPSPRAFVNRLETEERYLALAEQRIHCILHRLHL